MASSEPRKTDQCQALYSNQQTDTEFFPRKTRYASNHNIHHIHLSLFALDHVWDDTFKLQYGSFGTILQTFMKRSRGLALLQTAIREHVQVHCPTSITEQHTNKQSPLKTKSRRQPAARQPLQSNSRGTRILDYARGRLATKRLRTASVSVTSTKAITATLHCHISNHDSEAENMNVQDGSKADIKTDVDIKTEGNTKKISSPLATNAGKKRKLEEDDTKEVRLNVDLKLEPHCQVPKLEHQADEIQERENRDTIGEVFSDLLFECLGSAPSPTPTPQPASRALFQQLTSVSPTKAQAQQPTPTPPPSKPATQPIAQAPAPKLGPLSKSGSQQATPNNQQAKPVAQSAKATTGQAKAAAQPATTTPQPTAVMSGQNNGSQGSKPPARPYLVSCPKCTRSLQIMATAMHSTSVFSCPNCHQPFRVNVSQLASGTSTDKSAGR